MDEKLDMKAIASMLEKAHVLIWTSFEEEDDSGVIITHREDAERSCDLIDEKDPESFAKVVALLRKAKIPLVAKTWDDDDDNGFNVFGPTDDEDEDEDEDDDEDDDDEDDEDDDDEDDDDEDDDDEDDDDEIEYDDSDIKQKYLITMDDCTPCVTRKKKYSKEIKSGKIIVVNENTGKGKTIAKALDIDAFPVLVAELTPSAVKKNKLKSPYISLDD